MAHFAELDDDNIVTQVIVISNDDILDENGVEREEIGIELCKKIVQNPNSKWKQTSYNFKFRKNFASKGYKYDEERDAFIPEPLWNYLLLDEATCTWRPPIPKPNLTTEEVNSNCYYFWDHSLYIKDNTKGWVLKQPVINN